MKLQYPQKCFNQLTSFIPIIHSICKDKNLSKWHIFNMVEQWLHDIHITLKTCLKHISQDKLHFKQDSMILK